jgi:hypothetical protein
MFAHRYAAFDATLRRELAEHHLNRFLHVHLALCAVAGLLPLLTPDAAERSVPAWVLQAMLYCLSLSALLLGLSAAQGDADEFPVLFTQPVGRGAWLAGKVAALATLLGPASLLLIVPAIVLDGMTALLPTVAAAAAGVCLALAMLGLCVGLWVRDAVRGLLVALGAWFTLLCGIDLGLLAVSGAGWVQAHQEAWVLPLMLNPLSALRVTMMFALEETAAPSVGSGILVGWWLEHGVLWLALLLSGWIASLFGLGVLGARRRLDV